MGAIASKIINGVIGTVVVGVFAHAIYKNVRKSKFWSAFMGPEQKDPYEMMNEVAKKAARKAADDAAANEAAAKVATKVPKKGCKEQMDCSVCSEIKCAHCKGHGIHQKTNQMCLHCKGHGSKPKVSATPKTKAPTSGKDVPKAQGYKGKSEFYIEGYDKMSPEEKRAAKQAKWNEIQAANARKSPRHSKASSAVSSTNSQTLCDETVSSGSGKWANIEVPPSWGEQVFDEEREAAL